MSATLVPTSDESSSGTIIYSSGSTAWNLLDDNDGDTNVIQFSSDGFASMNYSDLAANAVTINSVMLTASYSSVGAYDTQRGRLFVKISGTKYYSGYTNLTTSSPGYGSFSNTWTQNPATGSSWTVVEVNGLVAGIEISSWSANDVKVSYVAATIDYLQLPPSVDVVRHLASVDLSLKSQPEAFGTLSGNLDLLNVPILGVLEVEHTAGPHATGIGWEDEVWQRRPMAIHGLSIDQNAYTVTAEVKDQRPIRRLVRDLAWSDKASGLIGDGIARFATPGATFTFERTGEHTFTNPVGESETAPANVPAYGDGGLYILPASGGRGAARFYVTNNSGERTLNALQGSFQCQVNLEAVSAVANQTVAYVYHDASNWWWIYWDPVTATDRWVFEVRAGGSTYRAIKTATPSSATWYQIGARWTGSNTENGDAAYTLSIFIDRVKGTDAAAGAAMTEVASSNFDFGTKGGSGTDILNGRIRKIHSYQDALTDTEMMRTI